MTTIGRLPSGDLERPRSSGSSNLHFRSSSSTSEKSSPEHKTKHKHNDYSCYIHVINKTGVALELVDSKAISGHWATGSPAAKIQSDTSTLVELTDPKGPHGSEGWCKYRFHHPDKSSTVSFKLKFKDPYWVRDDNFLQPSTQYPQWVSLKVLEYETNGHPFIAYVEVSLPQNTSPKSQKSQKSQRSVDTVDSDTRPKSESSADTLPEYDAGPTPQLDFGKDSTNNAQPIEANPAIDDMIQARKARSIVSVQNVRDEREEEEEGEDAEKKREVAEVEAEDATEHESEIKASEPEQKEDQADETTPNHAEPVAEISHDEETAENESANEQTPNPEETVLEPIAESAEEPAIETIVEVVAEPVIEPIADAVPEPVAEPTSEPAAEPVSEAPFEPVAEPMSEPIAKSAIESAEDSVVEPTSEPTIEPAVETVTEPVSNFSKQPTPEPSTLPSQTTVEASTQTEIQTQSETSTPSYPSESRTQEDKSSHETSSDTDEDGYVRVSELAFNAPNDSDAIVIQPTSSPSSSPYWDIISSPNVKMGVVAIMFLTTYGFTMARISRGLFFGVGRFRR